MPAGFESLYYGQMRPSPVLITSIEDTLPVRLVTFLSLGKAVKNMDYDNSKLSWADVESERKYSVKIDV